MHLFRFGGFNHPSGPCERYPDVWALPAFVPSSTCKLTDRCLPALFGMVGQTFTTVPYYNISITPPYCISQSGPARLCSCSAGASSLFRRYSFHVVSRSAPFRHTLPRSPLSVPCATLSEPRRLHLKHIHPFLLQTGPLPRRQCLRRAQTFQHS